MQSCQGSARRSKSQPALSCRTSHIPPNIPALFSNFQYVARKTNTNTTFQPLAEDTINLLVFIYIKKKNVNYLRDLFLFGQISYFKTKSEVKQCAIGVSFDFEKLVTLVSEKTAPIQRNELVICSVGERGSAEAVSLTLSKSSNALNDPKLKQIQQEANVNSILQQEVRNRLHLFKRLAALNRSLNISTHFAHEKFTVSLNFKNSLSLLL